MGRSRKNRKNTKSARSAAKELLSGRKLYLSEAKSKKERRSERKKARRKQNTQNKEATTTSKPKPPKGSTAATSHWRGGSNSTTLKKQQIQNQDNVIYTDKGALEFIKSKAWGTVLVPVDDSRVHKVTYDELESINLIDDFPKVPSDLWARWIALCFHFCPEKAASTYSYTGGSYSGGGLGTVKRVWNPETKAYETYKFTDGKRIKCSAKPTSYAPSYRTNTGGSSSSTGSCGTHSGELEVTMLFCRKISDLSQWRILVPKQVVTGGSARADLSKTCDLITGEMFDIFPPEGWAHAGSSHSHNTMSSFFSSVDDGSELGVPGLHIVVGKINKRDMTYEHKSSIVLRQMRKKVDTKDVVDLVPVEDITFHANVLSMVSSGHSLPEAKKPGKSTISISSNAKSKTQIEKEATEEWSDWFRDLKAGEDDDDEDVIVAPGYLAWRRRQARTFCQEPTPEIKTESLKTIGDDCDDDDFDDIDFVDRRLFLPAHIFEDSEKPPRSKQETTKQEMLEQDIFDHESDAERVMSYYESIQRPFER